MRNVEIKARVADVAALERRAVALADRGPERIAQHDTFFRVARGRLKLRRFEDGRGELIFYERPDSREPVTSSYRIAPTAEAAPLEALLAEALGVRGVVLKERRLYLQGRTRIHVDRVEGLGSFLELEVVLEERESPADGRVEAERLMRELGVRESDLVDVAYIDLLDAPRRASS